MSPGSKLGQRGKAGVDVPAWLGGPQRRLSFFPQLGFYLAEEIADGLDHLGFDLWPQIQRSMST